MMIGMEQEESLGRLGRTIVARRTDLGYPTRQAFADEVNLTYRVLTDLENGKRMVGPKTYASIEQALRWAPGSVGRVLRGEEPVERAALPSGTPPHERLGDWRSYEGVVTVKWGDIATLQERIARLPMTAVLYISTVVDLILDDIASFAPPNKSDAPPQTPLPTVSELRPAKRPPFGSELLAASEGEKGYPDDDLDTEE